MALAHIRQDIPVIAFCNILEAFIGLLSRAATADEVERLSRGEFYGVDRTLLWVGDPKLAIGSYPIHHADYIRETLGYPNSRYIHPTDPSKWLSQDALRETWMIDEIVAYAGDAKTVQIIPYQTTLPFFELVEHLRNEHGLTVLLPESLNPSSHWVRDLMDTKIGYHSLVGRFLSDAGDLLPLAFAAHNFDEAIQRILWFLKRGQSCIVKGNDGENGHANLIFDDLTATGPAIRAALESLSFLHDTPMVVEEMIPSENELSPSLEVYVPPKADGEPKVTYISQQLFKGPGDFCGVLVSYDLKRAPWYATLERNGLRIARELQALGYVGMFDLDCIVSDGGRLYLVEINSRRTGGTHVHDFAMHRWGEDYLEYVSLLSNESMQSGDIRTHDILLKALYDLLYPIDDEERGVIVTVTASLSEGKFGCIFVGQSEDDLLAMQDQVNARIQNFSR